MTEDTTTTEWEIVSLAASWMETLFAAHKKASPFKSARVERKSEGSQQRRDITLLDHDGRPLVTGEVKLPWAKDGHSPFVESIVLDARDKAARANVDWFFTWNLNELVLWQRSKIAALGTDRAYEKFEIADIHRKAQRLDPRVEDKIRNGIELFTLKLIKLVRDNEPLPLRSPDDYFVKALESFLKRPIEETRQALRAREDTPARKGELDKWMRDDQGWTLGTDRDDLLDRASKFACYATVNKLVFYEALKKRFARLPDLKFSDSVQSKDEALDALEGLFGRAKRDSGDYETIFGFDRKDFGIQIPFLSTAAVDGWRPVLDHVDKFDFTKIDYDVIGRIFERLIAPEERHKFGQYYTRPEVVDLINAFCIKAGTDKVFDPGCGGGTFLVRAYARKRFLDPALSHRELLATVFGTDISHFAAHLTTINLATRELVEERNYPRVQRSDFFDTAPDKTLIELPFDDGYGKAIKPGLFDAMIANPPYVRQEDIGKTKKTKYAAQVQKSSGLRTSGRSDLHVYFWGHAFEFLKPHGRLGFLTSSQWLDVEYGFPLQDWILKHFKIIAILESHGEPWFEGARVATVATILEREDNAEKRDENQVRFVELRQPLSTLMGPNDSREMLIGAERIRDAILATESNSVSPDFRVRLVSQAQLLADGQALGERSKGRPIYAGGKWGIPLRAPDIWFDLLKAGEGKWKPLGELADVARGITSGCDDFFYLRDISAESLQKIAGAQEFLEHYGVARDRVTSAEIIIGKTGTGEAFPLEAKFLAPIVHSLMDVDRYEIGLAQCDRRVLMVKSDEKLKGTFVGKYIEWGVEQKYHSGSTCAARESKSGRRWFDLTMAKRAALFWPKSHQYRHCAPYNPEMHFANCNLYTVVCQTDPHAELAFAVLNSSIVVLAKYIFGRPVGVEGAHKTEIVDVNMMPVPDWSQSTDGFAKRLVLAASKLRNRAVGGFLSERTLREKSFVARGKKAMLAELSDLTELHNQDRQELDDLVLELLGIDNRQDRKRLRDRLYAHLKEYFEKERRKEEEAQDNKRRTKARERQTPDGLAQAVFDYVAEHNPLLLRGYEDLADKEGFGTDQGRFVPWPDKLEIVDDLLQFGLKYKSRKTGKIELVRATSREQVELMIEVSLYGEGGDAYFFPADPVVAKRLAADLKRIRIERERLIRESLEDRTSDPDLVEKAMALAMPRFRRYKPPIQ
jgi:methylase of polypeptide subunit release factors